MTTLVDPERPYVAQSIHARRGAHPCRSHDACNEPGYVYRWVYENLPAECFLCLRPLTADNQQVDHIVPFASGGKECVDNVARCCATCNKLKGSLALEDLFTSHRESP